MSEGAGRCPQCGGDMMPRTTAFCFGPHSASRPALVENIPTLICRQCGRATYSLTVAQEIDRLLDQRPPPSRTVTIPVYELVDGS